ncbi:class I SAM-dependent methyltransferase [Brevundimonas sp.]|uniref:class I SAM-dependent methyltransferase n=1 Tax=Brevundimonas sp. TaxID=1871086 RepID=UPI0035175B7C
MIGFDDPATVARYADNPPRVVPGFHDLQRMTRLLLAETAPVDGQILVVGAGGGLELRAFAEAQPLWRFVGVDPSAAMLKLARLTLGSLGERAELHQGYIATAPEGPFDAASCLLTLHFVPEAARVATLAEIRRRLRPGAAFVVAHHSLPEGHLRDSWLDRFAAFGAEKGAAFDAARGGARALGRQLPILPPETELVHLLEAGFRDPQLFYAAFTFRGWVAHA